jgi:putative ABC transport system permease protein
MMQDLRLALRALFARPAFTAVAILTLALGVGANTAVFTVFHAVLLAPLPYADSSSVVVLNETTPQFPTLSVSRHNFDDWRARAQSFSGMSAFRSVSQTLTGAGDPERLPTKMMTATLLSTLGVAVEHGRGFTDADDKPGAEGVVLLSAAFADRKFGGVPAIGRVLQLDNRPYTVVGVLPRSFELFQPADLYVPFGPWAATLPDDRGWHPGIFPIARLKPGVSIDQARVEMDTISKQLERQYPETNTNTRALVTRVQDQLVQNVKPALLVLLSAVGLVLLIACANVANLLLSRASSRQKEIAVRIALGAARSRIVRQLVVESLVLACVGGLAGLLVASWGVSLLAGATIVGLPRAQNIGIAWPIIVFALGISMLTGLIFGLAPALQSTKFDIRESLHEQGRGSSSGLRHRRMREVLVVAEIALALVLLVGAGLLFRSYSALTRLSTGFNAENLLVVNLPLSPRTYGDPAVRTALVDRIVERMRTLPSVESAAMTTVLPMAGGGATIHFNRTARPPKSPAEYVMAGYRAATPGYLSTLGVPLKRGRMLEERDVERAPKVVLINESMARQFFPDVDPIGQRVQLGTEPSSDDPTMEIVGVVGDVRQSFEAGSKAEMFVPYAQFPISVLTGMYLNTVLVIRTTGEPSSVTPSVRAALREIDPNQPLVNVRTMETAIAGTVAQPRLQMVLLVVFASIAMALAVVGVYGVMAYMVSQRVPEIGVRMAVGASPQQVVRMVVRHGAHLAVIGILLGLLAAGVAAPAMQTMLFELHGLDALTFAGAALILGAAALLACYLPARRAARISPLAALRS